MVARQYQKGVDCGGEKFLLAEKNDWLDQYQFSLITFIEFSIAGFQSSYTPSSQTLTTHVIKKPRHLCRPSSVLYRSSNPFVKVLGPRRAKSAVIFSYEAFHGEEAPS